MTDSEKLDLILSEMQSMKTDMQNMKTDVQSLKTDVQDLKTDVQSLKTDVQDLKTDVQNLKADVQSLKTDTQELKERVSATENKVTDIKLIIENEIRVNIQRVAEGHLDLSRNLHEALKIDSEKEMLSIRVSVLESELRRIKAQLEIA